MSSTDPEHAARAVRTFFEKRLVPAARRAGGQTNDRFPRHPQPDLATYYRDRPRRVIGLADLELPACEGFEAFGAALAALWTGQGDSALAELAPEIVELARQLYSIGEQTDEVSPFLYVMF